MIVILYVWRYDIPNGMQYFEQEPELICEKTIDQWTSLIWCERAQKPGEFKLIMNATPELLQYFKKNSLVITRQDTDVAMIPELIKLKTSKKNGSRLEISGKSAEGLFRRRIVQQKGTGEFENPARVITYYIQENMGAYWYYNSDSGHPHRVNPNSVRYSNLLLAGTIDARISGSMSVEAFSANLGDLIEECCKAGDFCFKTAFNDGKFVYSCYVGEDRSLNQSERDPVIFSDDFKNLGDAEYTYSLASYYTQVIAGGSGTGTSRADGSYASWWRHPIGQGLNRREAFVNASGVSDSMLNKVAQNAQMSCGATESMTVTALSGGKYQYRKDYWLGDTVSIKHPYGITGTAMVSEVVETVDLSGYKVIPTFANMEVDTNA